MVWSDELLQKATQGDADALERLLSGLHRRLQASLESKIPAQLRSIVTAEDVLQDAYVTVFQDITKFEPRGEAAFFAWVAKIAESRLLDAIKAQRAAKRGGGRQRIEAPAAADDNPVSWLELLSINEHTPSASAAGHESVRRIQLALDELAPDYRTALRLRYIEGLPVAQAADRMGRTEGAVCLLCHRGIKQLRERLGSSTQFFLRGS